MKSLTLGQMVKLATHPNLIFKITKVNPDFSYQVQMDGLNRIILSYDNVPFEMLKRVSITLGAGDISIFHSAMTKPK